MNTETIYQKAAFNPTAMSVSTNLQLRPSYAEQLYKNDEIRKILALFHPSLTNADRRGIFPGTIHESNFGKSESTVHLVRRDAIKIVIVHADDYDMLRSLEVNVGVLLHNDPNHQPSCDDLEMAQSAVIDLITPLLMHPQHAEFLIPGLSMKEKPWEFTTWSKMEGVVILPRVALSSLHNLDHVYWGGRSKVTKSFIQVGTPGSGSFTRFEKTKSQTGNLIDGAISKNSVCVRITLDEEYIHGHFRWSDCSPYGGLTGANRMDIAGAFGLYAARLRGYFLSVPNGSTEESTFEKTARLIAVAFRINRSMGPELVAIANEVLASSNISHAELRRAVSAEAAKLKRIPIANLFTPDVFAAPVTKISRNLDYPVHPLVAAMRSTAANSLAV
jgi:hypothetical protein